MKLDSEKRLLKALKQDLPEKFQQLKLAWQKIDTEIHKYASSLPNAEAFWRDIDFVASYSNTVNFFKYAKNAWLPDRKETTFLKTDRLGQHIRGYMFTSNEFPWPVTNDVPDLPKLQLDLDKISEFIGVNIGNGFLQFFEEYTTCPSFRHIPRIKISEELITELPEFTNTVKRQIRKKHVEDFNETFGDEARALTISGFSKKTLAIDFTYGFIYGDLRQIISEDYVDLYSSIEEDFNHFDLLSEAFVKYSKIMYEQFRFEPQLFGLHQPQQHSFDELETTLFDNAHFDVGGAILIKQSPEKPETFSYDWAAWHDGWCYYYNWDP